MSRTILSSVVILGLHFVFYVATQNKARADGSVASTYAASDDFVVRSFVGGPSAKNVSVLCQSLRKEFGRAWCGTDSLPRWQPSCEIVLHPSRAKYVQAVGPDGAQTFGSSLIHIDSGKTQARRIDLLIDANGELTALPHELTHVVLSDRFAGWQPPHWLDEGAAMLADKNEKQSLHARDCHLALHQGTAMPLATLLTLEQFTSATQMPAFYGQSASLMRFFSSRGSIDKVTVFGLDAIRNGYDSALSKHYGIASVNELERQWKAFAYGIDPETAAPAVLAVSFRP